jgi:hypothetical protein
LVAHVAGLSWVGGVACQGPQDAGGAPPHPSPPQGACHACRPTGTHPTRMTRTSPESPCKYTSCMAGGTASAGKLHGSWAQHAHTCRRPPVQGWPLPLACPCGLLPPCMTMARTPPESSRREGSVVPVPPRNHARSCREAAVSAAPACTHLWGMHAAPSKASNPSKTAWMQIPRTYSESLHPGASYGEEGTALPPGYCMETACKPSRVGGRLQATPPKASSPSKTVWMQLPCTYSESLCQATPGEVQGNCKDCRKLQGNSIHTPKPPALAPAVARLHGNSCGALLPVRVQISSTSPYSS